jgi:predicted transcriptional regulator
LSVTNLCDNPRCTCDPCLCEECRCNTVRLGRLEQQVMGVLWAADAELSGRQIADRLPRYAYTTVSTVLDRLSHKGLTRRRLEGRTRRYRAARTEAEHTAALMHEAFRTSGAPEVALAAFVGTMTTSELAALRTILKR